MSAAPRRRAGGAKAAGGRRPARGKPPAGRAELVTLPERKLKALKQALGKTAPPRWNADPKEVRRSLARLVLALVEFLRQLMERQAIRRLEQGSLDPDEVEQVGLALMNLEKAVAEVAAQFDLDPSELNLELGPLGRLV